jgi:hypothetical protein
MILKLFIWMFSIIFITQVYSQSNADYFPWKTGDMWEYTLHYLPDIDTLQTIVIYDSTDESGNIYTTYFSRGINPIEPPSALLQDTITYKIDTSLYVYHRYFDFNNGEWINVYRLNGVVGNKWVMWDYNLVGGYGCEMAKIDSVNDINLFGQITKLMYMSYFWEYFDGTDTIKLYRYYDQLAKGFGFYFRGGVELNAQIYLHGAVIHGLLYGDTTVVSLDNIIKGLPSHFELGQNYPNPFNPSTKIRYEIPERSFVTLNIYDILGNEIATLVKEEKLAGEYEIEFNAANLPSGIYFYTLSAGNYFSTKKMILLK